MTTLLFLQKRDENTKNTREQTNRHGCFESRREKTCL